MNQNDSIDWGYMSARFDDCSFTFNYYRYIYLYNKVGLILASFKAVPVSILRQRYFEVMK
jgi:hypothetical protein